MSNKLVPVIDLDAFKTNLLTGEYGVDDLMQLYFFYKEMDETLGGENPFARELKAVSEALEQLYPFEWQILQVPGCTAKTPGDCGTCRDYPDCKGTWE